MYGEQEEKGAEWCSAYRYKNENSAPRRVLGIFSFKGEGARAIPDFYFWRKNMFVIKHPSGQYFHKDRQIILYESPEQAQIYLEAFAQYGLNRTAQEMEHPMEIMEFQQELSQCQIMPIDFDIEQQKDKVKTIWMHELEN